MGSDGGHLIQKLSISTVMSLLGDGVVTEEDGNLKFLHGEIQDDIITIHSRHKRLLVWVLGLRREF